MITRINQHTARWLPWLLLALYVVATLAGLTLQVLAGRYLYLGLAPLSVFTALLLFACALVGALLASRHPRHPAGWLWLAIALFVSLDLFCFGYATYGLVTDPGSLPLAELALLEQTSAALPYGIVAFTILMLTFPDGRLPSPRWRLVVLLSLAALAVYVPLVVFRPGPLLAMTFVVNPHGVAEALWRRLGPIMYSALALMLLALALAIASHFVRLRRSAGPDRQYIKWLIYMMALFVLGVLFQNGGFALGLVAAETLYLVGFALQIVAFTGLMVVIVTGILRIQLYDVDIVINRTLVYGLLTAVLAVVYLGSVIALQALFHSLTGQESPLAIVMSTLLIAALFAPLRRGLQGFIDRRFYRRKYDAARTLAAFAATVRDEVDLERLTAELLRVVDETMQPVKVSLWLREN